MCHTLASVSGMYTTLHLWQDDGEKERDIEQVCLVKMYLSSGVKYTSVLI